MEQLIAAGILPPVRPSWACNIPRQPLTVPSLRTRSNGAMPLYILRAHIILASVENRHEVIVAARADMASMILWMREEIIERGAEGSGDVHWVDWYPFLDFQALGKLATFDYPPISTPAGTTSSIVLSGDSEPSTVSGTVTAYMDPRPFCTQLPSGLYAFDDEKIVAAWLHWTTE